MNSFLELKFSKLATMELAEESFDCRQNAIFIYAKLCQAGVDRRVAKEAVEKLFHDGAKLGSIL
jgi:hypothetical protein